MIPASFPYLVTGLLTAWGSAWNATVVAEPLADVTGLGSYMDSAAERGDVAGSLASVLVMTSIVVAVNKMVWKNFTKRRRDGTLRGREDKEDLWTRCGV